MMSIPNGNRRQSRKTRSLAAAAALAVLLSGASAFAQAASGNPVSSYRIYPSHVVWQGDCVAEPSAAAGQPDYRIYKSHVVWRNDEVAQDVSQSGQPQWPRWEIFDSHVARSDACSLHPTVMPSPLPSYGWNDVERVLGFTGRQG